ncbi:MAG: aconitate hydratase [Candidatus Wallbacteria bacterium]|nr:aconitate hydratase [Candidatus Wallbacteria bacterium]
MNLTEKIIKSHLVSGEMKAGASIAIRIDQTLTQDATGTMAYLQFEALEVPRVKTELSVSYVDHNMLQSGYENADDHAFLQSIAAKHGIFFSKPGNGICHQVHLERFGVPGKTLLGSDSHTPTCGGLGMIAIGAGGLDIALAMAGEPFYLSMPRVFEVYLTGELQPFVSAKDVILELLRLKTVKGGVGIAFEFTGPGVKTLSIPERATITNMGAELGATFSIFPSDIKTKEFFKLQQREIQWLEMKPDQKAGYDGRVEIDLSKLEPLIAKPHMPDQVVTVKSIAGKKVQQVVVGSCTNSSYKDIKTVAGMLKNRHVHPEVSMGLLPGSRQVLKKLISAGEMEKILDSGVRLLECSCGPCIGMGFSPPSKGISLRTFNRNFEGRSGTKDAEIYLCSPETAVAAALTGQITDPRELGIEAPKIEAKPKFVIDDSLIIPPAKDGSKVTVVRGPNIQPLPKNTRLEDKVEVPVILKVGNDITTDHIMPAGAKILPLRSNVPKIAEHVFEPIDPTFAKRAKEAKQSVIVGGANYGQGSSREHAALAPMYLGIKAVLVKSFARIHLANLVNFGIMPLTFQNPEDYDKITQGDLLQFDFSDISKKDLQVTNKTKNQVYKVTHPLSSRDVEIVKAGGSLAFTSINQKK